MVGRLELNDLYGHFQPKSFYVNSLCAWFLLAFSFMLCILTGLKLFFPFLGISVIDTENV